MPNPNGDAGLAAVAFTHTFGTSMTTEAEDIPTPTDYFRYRILIASAREGGGALLYQLEDDYAFLMENQWILPLPEVQEETEGAAPDELIVYYCDMFPFQRDGRDRSTRLPRESVPGYVQATLVPAMVEAFRTQSDVWGFTWHEAWTSYRGSAGAERLSVALTDGQAWFHGFVPVMGHSAISLNTGPGDEYASYDTLTDALLSTFHHELFHNLQRSINKHLGGDGNIDADSEAWHFFSEGTAFLASTVGLPDAHFTRTESERRHVANANAQIDQSTWGSGTMVGLCGALYWRFLYEQCGGTRDGVEDPAAGMAVVRNALSTLYSGDIVDITASADLLTGLPGLMDSALADTASCPFKTFEDSLIHFSRALYGLRLEGGRCVAPGIPSGCGLYDPNGLYGAPPTASMVFAGETDRLYWSSIRRSLGIDFIDILLDPAADGTPLTLEFQAASEDDTAFAVQVWRLIDQAPVAVPEVLTTTCPDGRRIYLVSAVETSDWNRLAVIVTRTDGNEHSHPVAGYSIRLRSGDAGAVDALCTERAAQVEDPAGYVGADMLYLEPGE